MDGGRRAGRGIIRSCPRLKIARSPSDCTRDCPHSIHRDIKTLAEALKLPLLIPLHQKKGKIDRNVGLAILLHWLAFPVRQQNDMERFWQRDYRLISRCVVGFGWRVSWASWSVCACTPARRH